MKVQLLKKVVPSTKGMMTKLSEITSLLAVTPEVIDSLLRKPTSFDRFQAILAVLQTRNTRLALFLYMHRNVLSHVYSHVCVTHTQETNQWNSTAASEVDMKLMNFPSFKNKFAKHPIPNSEGVGSLSLLCLLF